MTASFASVMALLRERRIARRARLDYKREFSRGYQAGIRHALSLLPETHRSDVTSDSLTVEYIRTQLEGKLR